MTPVVEIVAPSRVRPGELVPIALRITNPGTQPLELHLQGRDISFDLVVAREDGTVVWRRLAGAVVQGILQLKTLAPGETLELTGQWPQRTNAGAVATSGDYTVTGILPTDGQPLRTAPVRLRITP